MKRQSLIERLTGFSEDEPIKQGCGMVTIIVGVILAAYVMFYSVTGYWPAFP